jgi:solute:Na+ symporter, SSS family
LLAPSTSFIENIYKNLRPKLSDKEELLGFRIALLVFTAGVLTYAVVMRGTPIYEMVSSAYQVTLVSAFLPLTCGLYWKRATEMGAIASIVLGIGTWLVVLLSPLGTHVPAPLAGLAMAAVGMVCGSLLSKPKAK